MLIEAVGLLVGLLFPVALVGGVIALIVRARGGRGAEEEPRVDAGVGTVRRLFLYGVGALALVFAGVGLALLLSGVLDAAAGDTVVSENDTELATALSFCIVGIPAWLLAAVLARRTMIAAPEAELRSEARRFYLGFARGIALVIAAVSALAAGTQLLHLDDFDGTSWGWLLVWAAIWLVHERVARSEPTTEETRGLEQTYRVLASAFGLYFLVAGVASGVGAVASAAYDALFRPALVEAAWSGDLRAALPWVAVGAAVWTWHWLFGLRRDDRSEAPWQVAVFIFGILPALGLTLIPAAIALLSLLDFWLGPSPSSAAVQFAGAPRLATLAAVGLATWVYFRAVLSERAEAAAPGDAERSYRYLVAASGLVVLSLGIVFALTLAIEAIAPRETVIEGDDWWRERLVSALTCFIVGLPVWLVYWLSEQRALARAPEEAESLPRRAYLFTIFGVATVVTLINLIVVLFQVFDALLGEGLSSDVLRDTRWSVALVVTAGLVAGYHWAVLREDPRSTPAAPMPAPRRRMREVMLVLPPGAGDIEAEFAGLDGIRLRVWRRGDIEGGAALTDEQRTALVDRVMALETDCLVLMSPLGDLEVVPIEASTPISR